MAHIFASVAQHECHVLDNFVLFLDLNANKKVLPHLLIIQYVAAFSDRLDVRRFVLGIHIDKPNFYMTFQRHLMLTAAGARLRHWNHFGGREATLPQCAGPEIDMPYVRMAERKGYERRSYRMLQRLRRQIDWGDLSQSTIHLSVDLVRVMQWIVVCSHELPVWKWVRLFWYGDI